MMKTKQIYIIPNIEIIPMQMENLLDTLSIPISNGSSNSGGDAKGGYFDEAEEEEKEFNPNLWGEPLF